MPYPDSTLKNGSLRAPIDVADRLVQLSHRTLPSLDVPSMTANLQLNLESNLGHGLGNGLGPHLGPNAGRNSDRSVDSDVPLISEMPVQDQDEYYGGPRNSAREIIDACCALLRGSDASPFVLWNARNMRFEQVQPARHPGLSVEITTKIFVKCANTATLIKRLATVGDELDNLDANIFGPAVGGAVKSALSEILVTLPLPYPSLSPVDFLHAIRQPSLLTAEVAELIGCDNLELPAHFHGLPDPAALLNRAWAFAHASRASTRYDATIWGIVGAVFRPWLDELALATGQSGRGVVLKCSPQFAELHFSSLFVTPDSQSRVYLLQVAKLPSFVSRDMAIAVVEVLNCLVLTGHVATGPAHDVWPSLDKPQEEMVRPLQKPFAISRVDELANLHLDGPEPSQPPSNHSLSDLTRGFIVNLQKLAADAQSLSTKLIVELKSKLQPHLNLLCEILLCHDGTLCSCYNPTSLKEALSRHGAESIAHVNDSDIIYTPPTQVSAFVDLELVHKFKLAGSKIRAAQANVRSAGLNHTEARPATKKLEIEAKKLTETVKRMRREFDAASTVQGLVEAFRSVNLD